jgi:hypothetical protein
LVASGIITVLTKDRVLVERRSATVREALAQIAAERTYRVHPLLRKALELEGLVRESEGGTTLTPAGRALLKELERHDDLPTIE